MFKTRVCVESTCIARVYYIGEYIIARVYILREYILREYIYCESILLRGYVFRPAMACAPVAACMAEEQVVTIFSTPGKVFSLTFSV